MSKALEIPVCWKHENVGKTISIKAKIDEKQTHYFMASHSPMTHIQDEKAKRKISEEGLYKNVITSGQRDKQVVIYGEPGTGKSHLVHWLKLRYSYGIKTGELNNIVPVLIERRSGSLKDALTQLIQQLGASFQKYLDPVQQALEQLSDSTARQKLANELSLELGPRWSDRRQEGIDKRLKYLGQACRAEGFGGWLCRDDGVIDRTINLLIESSEVKDRENAPRFQANDLLVKDKFRTNRKNSQEVIELIDELDDSKSLRDLASNHMNEALRHAIVSMVGLSGANLRKVFDAIREDLATENKHLALFIEDVSAMSELDVEIVNALEPQDRTALCPLTAVLGMTHTGYAKLRDNQKQRIEFVYRVDGETTANWSQDKDSLAKFTARYLNAIRLEEEDVKQIAEDRRAKNGDVTKSKCQECPAKEICHSTFGVVELNGVEIGLYPFSSETAPRVLDLIRNDDSTPYSPNQRGLLIHLLSPVLSDTESLKQGEFPSVDALPVRVSDPYYWTEFRRNYLGDYSESERNRIHTLAGLWIEQTDQSDLAASSLKPFLEPLGLPAFTKEVKTVAKPVDHKTSPPLRGDGEGTVVKKKDQIKKYLDSLSSWFRGEVLKNESYFRDLLSSLVKNSIQWANFLQPAQFDSWTWSVVSGRKFISIEGQASSAERLCFEFPRNEETRSLLEALARFDKEGSKSWEFPQGEFHKRVVASWVRKHECSVVNALEPEVDRIAAVDSATQLLCLYSVVRDRKSVPQRSISELMDTLFKPKWNATPVSLSNGWNAILQALDGRHDQVAEFLKNEIAVRQGRGGIVFVSPELVMNAASAFSKTPTINDLAEDYASGVWKSRFAGLPSRSSPVKDQFGNLANVIREEALAIRAKVQKITSDLESLGFKCDDLKSDVMALCDQVLELNETCKESKVFLPNQAFEIMVANKVFTERKMPFANAIARALRVSDSDDPFEVLTFDPITLIELEAVLACVLKRIKELDFYVLEQEQDIKKGSDPETLVETMFGSLGKIADLSENQLEVDDVTAS